eukprot:gene2145-4177_t
MTTTDDLIIKEQSDAFTENYVEQMEFEDFMGQRSLMSVLPAFTSALTLSKMLFLDLDGKDKFRLDDLHIEFLVDSIKKSYIRLQRVRLRHHRIGDAGFVKLCHLVSSTDETDLRILDLEGNEITEKGCCVIQPCLDGSNQERCNLEELNLSWNPVGPDGAMALALALEKNSKLKRLFLGNCNLNLKALIAISNSTASNTTLESLILDRPLLTTLEEESVDHFSRLLAHQSSLTALSLRYNHVGDHGMRLLSQALMANDTLTSLNLDSNKICVGGANSIARTLVQVQRLKELRLSANRLGDEGARAIAEALKCNYSLTKVDLGYNGIGVSGLVAIGTALEKNNTLTRLAVWGNSFDDEAGRMYFDLARLRFPYVGLFIDIEVYVVDGVHMVAQKDLE